MESPVIKNVRYWLLLGRWSRDGLVEMSYFEGLFHLLTCDCVGIITSNNEELAVTKNLIGYW